MTQSAQVTQVPSKAEHSTTRVTRPLQTTLLIGVGGNAGSGKSTFVRELARLGAKLIDADRIGWELLEHGTPTARRVIRRSVQGF